MWRGCGAWLVLLAGCTRTDKTADTASEPGVADVAPPGYPDTDPETSEPESTETGTEPEPLAWVATDAGFVMSCGLLNDERVVCWGDPAYVDAAPAEPFLQMSFAALEGCGLRDDGTVGCWCGDSQGDENGSCEEVSPEAGFIEVQNGSYWACAERADHTLACWGDKARVSRAPAVPVLDWSIEINTGCAIVDDGSVTCWGATQNFNRTAPDAAIAPPADLTYVQVAVGRNHACALDTAGEVHCWGATQIEGVVFPQASPGPWASITAWNAFTCGIRADGTAECWHDMPGVSEVWIVPDEKWAMIGLGEWDACGVTLDGRGVCFPEVSNSAGEQDIPDLADLVLPAGG